MIYQVETHQDGRWWVITVTDGLPVNMLGVSQAKRLNEVDRVAKDLIGELLEVDPATIEIELTATHPSKLGDLLEKLAATQNREEEAKVEALEARRLVAKTFRAEGYTMRETGTALGVSHQRVKQLVD